MQYFIDWIYNRTYAKDGVLTALRFIWSIVLQYFWRNFNIIKSSKVCFMIKKEIKIILIIFRSFIYVLWKNFKAFLKIFSINSFLKINNSSFLLVHTTDKWLHLIMDIIVLPFTWLAWFGYFGDFFYEVSTHFDYC